MISSLVILINYKSHYFILFLIRRIYISIIFFLNTPIDDKGTEILVNTLQILDQLSRKLDTSIAHKPYIFTLNLNGVFSQDDEAFKVIIFCYRYCLNLNV
jgi:hypothetical protein